jgi:ubiquinone/menaquinone biosynthesis C-methylase UbiE
MRFFFYNFYHSFAWTYDFVAEVVSLGRWNTWVQTVIPFVTGHDILEIGHGPGHLQSLLLKDGNFVAGLDESPQMIRLTQTRLNKTGQVNFNLTRAEANFIPFASKTFDSVVSTFPTEILFDTHTLIDINRILRNHGRLILLPAAWITGNGILDRGAAWLFNITGQAPPVYDKNISEQIKRSVEKAGFEPEFQTIEIKSSLVLIMIAVKSKSK